MFQKLATVTFGGFLIAAAALVPLAPLHAAPPKGPLKFAIPAGPGGANDLLVRGLQKILENQKLVPFSVEVKNVPGGGGAVAWAMINRHKGDPNRLVTFMPNIFTNQLLGSQPFGYKNFTPIAILLKEDACFAVNPKGRIKSAQDLINAMKKDPSKLRFGFANARGNHWNQAMVVLAKALGVDASKIRQTVFGSGGKARTALLGRHTDFMVAGFGLFAKFQQAGRLKCVAEATKKRLWGLAKNVPTWRELGYNVVFSAWRGVMGPGGLSKSQIKYWVKVFRKAVKDPAWKKFSKRRYYRDVFMDHDETVKFLKKNFVHYKDRLINLGMLKK